MQVPPTELAARLRRDELVVCVCLTQPASAATPMALAAAGVDALYVDLEHTPLSLETAASLCVSSLAAGLLPLVRVPGIDASTIMRALDGGALGVIVPHVDSVEAARAVVQAARVSPLGGRHPYLATAVLGYRALPADEAVAALEASTVVAVMIESAAAVAAADDIAAVPGVDMLLAGAFDLANDLGCAADASELRDALLAVAAACDARGVAFGVLGVRSHDLIAELVSAGLRFVGAGTDLGLLQEATRAKVTTLRGTQQQRRGAHR